ncbi:hypothetical protein H7U20_18140 [Rugamonas sp. CCM 8940]|nr:hypothetical protein [Rugamonas sp. CCM 8940]
MRKAAHSYAVLGGFAGRVDMQVFYPRELLAQTEDGRTFFIGCGLAPRFFQSNDFGWWDWM